MVLSEDDVKVMTTWWDRNHFEDIKVISTKYIFDKKNPKTFTEGRFRFLSELARLAKGEDLSENAVADIYDVLNQYTVTRKPKNRGGATFSEAPLDAQLREAAGKLPEESNPTNPTKKDPDNTPEAASGEASEEKITFSASSDPAANAESKSGEATFSPPDNKTVNENDIHEMFVGWKLNKVNSKARLILNTYSFTPLAENESPLSTDRYELLKELVALNKDVPDVEDNIESVLNKYSVRSRKAESKDQNERKAESKDESKAEDEKHDAKEELTEEKLKDLQHQQQLIRTLLENLSGKLQTQTQGPAPSKAAEPKVSAEALKSTAAKLLDSTDSAEKIKSLDDVRKNKMEEATKKFKIIQPWPDPHFTRETVIRDEVLDALAQATGYASKPLPFISAYTGPMNLLSDVVQFASAIAQNTIGNDEVRKMVATGVKSYLTAMISKYLLEKEGDLMEQVALDKTPGAAVQLLQKVLTSIAMPIAPPVKPPAKQEPSAKTVGSESAAKFTASVQGKLDKVTGAVGAVADKISDSRMARNIGEKALQKVTGMKDLKLGATKTEAAKTAADKAAADKIAVEKAAADKTAADKTAAIEKVNAEKLAIKESIAQKGQQAREAVEKKAADAAAAAQAAAQAATDKVAAAKAAAQKATDEKAAAQKAIQEKAASDKDATIKAAEEKAASVKAAADEKAAAAKTAAENLALAKAATKQAADVKSAAEKAEKDKKKAEADKKKADDDAKLKDEALTTAQLRVDAAQKLAEKKSAEAKTAAEKIATGTATAAEKAAAEKAAVEAKAAETKVATAQLAAQKAATKASEDAERMKTVAAEKVAAAKAAAEKVAEKETSIKNATAEKAVAVKKAAEEAEKNKKAADEEHKRAEAEAQKKAQELSSAKIQSETAQKLAEEKAALKTAAINASLQPNAPASATAAIAAATADAKAAEGKAAAESKALAAATKAKDDADRLVAEKLATAEKLAPSKTTGEATAEKTGTQKVIFENVKPISNEQKELVDLNRQKITAQAAADVARHALETQAAATEAQQKATAKAAALQAATEKEAAAAAALAATADMKQKTTAEKAAFKTAQDAAKAAQEVAALEKAATAEAAKIAANISQKAKESAAEAKGHELALNATKVQEPTKVNKVDLSKINQLGEKLGKITKDQADAEKLSKLQTKVNVVDDTYKKQVLLDKAGRPLIDEKTGKEKTGYVKTDVDKEGKKVEDVKTLKDITTTEKVVKDGDNVTKKTELLKQISPTTVDEFKAKSEQKTEQQKNELLLKKKEEDKKKEEERQIHEKAAFLEVKEQNTARALPARKEEVIKAEKAATVANIAEQDKKMELDALKKQHMPLYGTARQELQQKLITAQEALEAKKIESLTAQQNLSEKRNAKDRVKAYITPEDHLNKLKSLDIQRKEDKETYKQSSDKLAKITAEKNTAEKDYAEKREVFKSARQNKDAVQKELRAMGTIKLIQDTKTSEAQRFAVRVSDETKLLKDKVDQYKSDPSKAEERKNTPHKLIDLENQLKKNSVDRDAATKALEQEVKKSTDLSIKKGRQEAELNRLDNLLKVGQKEFTALSDKKKDLTTQHGLAETEHLANKNVLKLNNRTQDETRETLKKSLRTLEDHKTYAEIAKNDFVKVQGKQQRLQTEKENLTKEQEKLKKELSILPTINVAKDADGRVKASTVVTPDGKERPMTDIEKKTFDERKTAEAKLQDIQTKILPELSTKLDNISQISAKKSEDLTEANKKLAERSNTEAFKKTIDTRVQIQSELVTKAENDIKQHNKDLVQLQDKLIKSGHKPAEFVQVETQKGVRNAALDDLEKNKKELAKQKQEQAIANKAFEEDKKAKEALPKPPPPAKPPTKAEKAAAKTAAEAAAKTAAEAAAATKAAADAAAALKAMSPTERAAKIAKDAAENAAALKALTPEGKAAKAAAEFAALSKEEQLKKTVAAAKDTSAMTPEAKAAKAAEEAAAIKAAKDAEIAASKAAADEKAARIAANKEAYEKLNAGLESKTKKNVEATKAAVEPTAQAVTAKEAEKGKAAEKDAAKAQAEKAKSDDFFAANAARTAANDAKKAQDALAKLESEKKKTEDAAANKIKAEAAAAELKAQKDAAAAAKAAADKEKAEIAAKAKETQKAADDAKADALKAKNAERFAANAARTAEKDAKRAAERAREKEKTDITAAQKAATQAEKDAAAKAVKEKTAAETAARKTAAAAKKIEDEAQAAADKASRAESDRLRAAVQQRDANRTAAAQAQAAKEAHEKALADPTSLTHKIDKIDKGITKSFDNIGSNLSSAGVNALTGTTKAASGIATAATTAVTAPLSLAGNVLGTGLNVTGTILTKGAQVATNPLQAARDLEASTRTSRAAALKATRDKIASDYKRAEASGHKIFGDVEKHIKDMGHKYSDNKAQVLLTDLIADVRAAKDILQSLKDKHEEDLAKGVYVINSREARLALNKIDEAESNLKTMQFQLSQSQVRSTNNDIGEVLSDNPNDGKLVAAPQLRTLPKTPTTPRENTGTGSFRTFVKQSFTAPQAAAAAAGGEGQRRKQKPKHPTLRARRTPTRRRRRTRATRRGRRRFSVGH